MVGTFSTLRRCAVEIAGCVEGLFALGTSRQRVREDMQDLVGASPRGGTR